MHNDNCLNCGSAVLSNFCGECGQKASTHRYSMVHFIQHDFVHGVWHVDKGILFTLKGLFTKPGHSVRDFVDGKRANYFSFVTLIILILAVSSFLGHYNHIKFTDLMPQASRDVMNSLEKFITQYPKLVLVITIPIYSFFSFLWFRKARYNYSEHLVLNSYKTAAELAFGLLFTIVSIFYTNIIVLTYLYYFVFSGFGFVYSTWFYFQFFSKIGYSKSELILRSVMVPVSYIFTSVLVGVVWGIITLLLGK